MAKILLIDDDDLFRQYMTTLLQRSGYHVRALSGGAGLLDIMAAESFDAVVTDLFMPDVDGIEIVMSVRRQFPRIPVIGVTGDRADSVENPCVAAMIRLGAAGVLRKPIDRRELMTLLTHVIDMPRGDPDD